MKFRILALTFCFGVALAGAQERQSDAGVTDRGGFSADNRGAVDTPAADRGAAEAGEARQQQRGVTNRGGFNTDNRGSVSTPAPGPRIDAVQGGYIPPVREDVQAPPPSGSRGPASKSGASHGSAR